MSEKPSELSYEAAYKICRHHHTKDNHVPPTNCSLCHRIAIALDAARQDGREEGWRAKHEGNMSCLASEAEGETAGYKRGWEEAIEFVRSAPLAGMGEKK